MYATYLGTAVLTFWLGVRLAQTFPSLKRHERDLMATIANYSGSLCEFLRTQNQNISSWKMLPPCPRRTETSSPKN